MQTVQPQIQVLWEGPQKVTIDGRTSQGYVLSLDSIPVYFLIAVAQNGEKSFATLTYENIPAVQFNYSSVLDIYTQTIVMSVLSVLRIAQSTYAKIEWIEPYYS